MKQIHYILLIIISIVLSSCGTSTMISSKDAFSVEQGMTKKDVEKILGAPTYKRFEGNIEELEYHRQTGSVIYPESIVIKILLVDGIVESMNSYNPYTIPDPQPPVVISANGGGIDEYIEPPVRIRLREMSREDFNRFFSDFKKEPFNSSRIDMMDNLSSSVGLTCSQCRSIVDLYTFSSDKKEWIRRLAPRIIDRENLPVLLDVFTFESDKSELRKYINSF